MSADIETNLYTIKNWESGIHAIDDPSIYDGGSIVGE